jgi:4-hydroxy-tetrahydrodipicolinate synthase
MRFRSDPAQIRGSIAPLMTPFTAEGAIDHASLTNLVNWQLANGTHGISIGGSTGEPSAQTISERVAAITTVAAAIDDRVPFMPGTGTEKLDETLELTAAARDAGVDAARISRVLQLCGRELLVWSGIELLCLPLLALGGVGFLSATANIAPRAHADLYEAWEAGDVERARELHYGLHPLVDLLFVETNPAPGKWVLEQRGLISSGFVRPPLIEPTPGGVEKMTKLLAAGSQYLSPVGDFPMKGH